MYILPERDICILDLFKWLAAFFATDLSHLDMRTLTIAGSDEDGVFWCLQVAHQQFVGVPRRPRAT